MFQWYITKLCIGEIIVRQLNTSKNVSTESHWLLGKHSAKLILKDFTKVFTCFFLRSVTQLLTIIDLFIIIIIIIYFNYNLWKHEHSDSRRYHCPVSEIIVPLQSLLKITSFHPLHEIKCILGPSVWGYAWAMQHVVGRVLAGQTPLGACPGAHQTIPGRSNSVTCPQLSWNLWLGMSEE